MPFFVPMILLITIMFGRLSAGPARSMAREGPFPIPSRVRALMIGTSVRVEKYMKAPATEDMKFEVREFPPTKAATYSLGSTTTAIPAKKNSQQEQGGDLF